MLRVYAYRCFFARRGKLPIRNRETVRDSERDKAETEKKTGWWLTYPSEKYDNSSVGMIVYSQLIWKVIQNSHGSSHHQPENFGLQDGDLCCFLAGL